MLTAGPCEVVIARAKWIGGGCAPRVCNACAGPLYWRLLWACGARYRSFFGGTCACAGSATRATEAAATATSARIAAPNW